ncbi:MAG: MFS transporter [Pseudopedobacter saltans]|uniref:MFS transporter n=1 Tax=Pseudopedobacter saltans TaxID=151895 RepID=A0A2W5H518_9SPHI|nr:MAG: MFS transporter [Pseudopedobacter saltans]
MNKTIYALALGVFGVITTEFGVIGILPVLAKHFNVSIDTAGWLLSGFALTVALCGPFVTSLTKYINRKTMLLAVLATFILSNLASALAPNFTVLLISRILPAIFYPAFWAIALTLAMKQVLDKDAPKAISIVMTGLSVATVLGVPITTYFADLFNWKASFYTAGAVNLVAFLILLFAVPSTPVERTKSASQDISILKEPFVWVNYFYILLMIAGMFATYSFLADYFTQITKMDGKEVSLMLLFFGGAGIIGNWLMGKIISKNVHHGFRYFPIALILVEVLAYFLGGYFMPMVAIIILWGFIHTAGFLVGNTRGVHGVPKASLEFSNSFLPSFFNLGITIGTMVSGFVIRHSNIHQVIWVSISFLGAAFLLSLVNVTKPKTINSIVLNEKDDCPILMHV